MPAQLLLVNPSDPRRRLGSWGETMHRAPGFSGLSRYPYGGFSYANPAPRKRRRKAKVKSYRSKHGTAARKPKRKRKFGGSLRAGPVRRHSNWISGSEPRQNPKKRRKAHGAKQMARRRKKKKVNSHARKVRAFMRKHPKATLAKASKAVAKKGKGRKKRRKNPSKQSLAIRRARAAGRGPKAVAVHPAKAAGKKARRRAMRKSRKSRKSTKRRSRRVSHRINKRLRRKSRALALKGRRLTKRIRRTTEMIAGSKSKRQKARLRARRKSMVARRGALAVKRRSLSKKWAGGSYARSHGLTRVNPSMSGVAKDLMALLPEVGAGVGSLVLLAVVGNKLQAKLPDSVKSKVPTSMVPWVPTITTGVLAAVAYGALRMSKNAKLSKLSVPVLIGGAAATALHAMVAIKVKGADGQQISLAKKLGLPMGEFVGVSGYVDVNGQMVAVNGLGEFVGVSGMMTDASGQPIAVNGLGEYLHEQVGLGSAGEGIFSRSSLGMLPDGSAAQEAGMGREWSHGLSEEVGAESILDEDGGSLSGSIFDD